jgi:hypothetical protein
VIASSDARTGTFAFLAAAKKLLAALALQLLRLSVKRALPRTAVSAIKGCHETSEAPTTSTITKLRGMIQ